MTAAHAMIGIHSTEGVDGWSGGDTRTVWRPAGKIGSGGEPLGRIGRAATPRTRTRACMTVFANWEKARVLAVTERMG